MSDIDSVSNVSTISTAATRSKTYDIECVRMGMHMHVLLHCVRKCMNKDLKILKEDDI